MIINNIIIFKGISTFLKENNITEIYCHCRIGKNLSVGLNSCKGDYIVFLEDDDKFTRDKLELVLKAFENNNIIYYHNNHEIIDKYSQILNLNQVKKKSFDRQFTRSTLWNPPHHYRRVIKYQGSFNLSSIAVNRSHIIKYNSVLAKIEVAADNIVFFLLLQYDLSFFFDISSTTLYRMHTNSETHTIHGDRTGAIGTLNRRYYSIFVVYKSSKSALVKKICVGWMLYAKFLAYLLGDKDIRPSFIAKLKLLYYSLTAPAQNKSYLTLLIAVFIHRIFPTYVYNTIKRTKKFNDIYTENQKR